ncbi:MAG: class I SAM-dependent RNA methyltransferase, partial [Verrucomicrobia bacterium]|nr:class I SAM-dependent RNA methyltransferase [Verrucomicrobiota bacterium]
WIVDIAFGGEGVARVADFVVFVPFVALGEEIELEITELKKRFARARLVRVLHASSERVTPACRYFGACGGCQYQHLAYGTQLALKHRQIIELFRRIGGFDEARIDPVIASPRPYGYRNRIMVRSQWDKFKQGLNIGFLRFDNRLVVDLEECAIAEPVLNDQLREVRAHPPPKGGIKVTLRVAPDGWAVPRDSFFQNNFHLLPELVRTVRERTQAGGARFLLDAYCGVGFFSLELGDLVEEFLGLELDRLAVEAAHKNAANRGRPNGRFLAGPVEASLPAAFVRFPADATLVMLDPPRTGCSRVILERLREFQPRQILYVSCHPATLARDVCALCADRRYELARVTPLDMFPQTQHIECIADLRWSGAPATGPAPSAEDSLANRPAD